MNQLYRTELGVHTGGSSDRFWHQVEQTKPHIDICASYVKSLICCLLMLQNLVYTLINVS